MLALLSKDNFRMKAAFLLAPSVGWPTQKPDYWLARYVRDRRGPMKKIPAARYQSPNEVDRQIKEKQAMADALPPGDTKQKLLIETARLRTYADIKRWASTG